MWVDSEKDDMDSLHSLLPWVPLPRTVGHRQATHAAVPVQLASPSCWVMVPASHGTRRALGRRGRPTSCLFEFSSSQGVGGFAVGGHGASRWKCGLCYSRGPS